MSKSLFRTTRVPVLTAGAILVALGQLTFAQGMLGLDKPQTLPSEATQALHHKKTDLRRLLSDPYTGNPDIDFLSMAITLQQSTIDAAQVELKYGLNDEAKAAASALISESRRRIEQLQALQSKLGSSGTSAVVPLRTQEAASAPASTMGYAEKVRACVQPRVFFNAPPRSSAANPTVDFRAQLHRDGSVRSVEIRRSSGNAKFDEALRKGIEACSPFPKPPSGKYPSAIEGSYRMYN